MTAGSPKRRWPCRTGEGQRSLARRPRAEAVLEARRVLRGERILLRPLASSDLRRCVKWFSDPQIIRFLGRDAPVTLAEEERWFRDYERRTDEQIFAIEVEGQHVGNLGLHKIDRVHRKAEVGIVIGEPSFWSQGYGTEAMRVVLRYGFDALGLNKISLDVLEYNTRALPDLRTTRIPARGRPPRGHLQRRALRERHADEHPRPRAARRTACLKAVRAPRGPAGPCSCTADLSS